MDLKDFTDLGNDIGRRVNDAINNSNFDRLNRDIRDKVDQAFYGGATGQGFGGLDGKLYHGQDKQQNAGYTGGQTAGVGGGYAGDFKLYREEMRPVAPTGQKAEVRVTAAGVPVRRKPQGRVSGVLMMVIGYAAAAGFGIAALVLGVLSATVSSVGSIPAGILGAGAAGFVPLFVAGLIVGIIGSRRYGLASRFLRYMPLMEHQKFFSIKDLAKKTGKSVKYICRDLQKMIDKRFFPQGHIDDHKTCFIGTDELYHQYIQARDSAAESAKTVQAQSQSQPGQRQETKDAQLEQVISEGREYIRTIREANDAIYNPDISQKLYRMENIVKKIFEYVRENPDQVGQLRKFMSYYMPTTEKLVNAYRQLDEQTIRGENISRAKEEIARTLDTINDAYEKLYDSMYVDVAMDVSSDIAVLKTLFAQEGLAEDQMNGGKKK